MINSHIASSVNGTYPVTLDEARDILEIVDTRHNSKINMLIAAATSKAENYTGQYFVSRSVVFNLDRLYSKIKLPIHPITSINSIEYLSEGNFVNLDATEYETDVNAFPPFIKILNIPNSDTVTNAIKITATAGYPTIELIPDDVKQAILFFVYQSFLNRGNNDDQVDKTFKDMLYSYRYMKL